MMGSQSGGRANDGPELPGMENLGADAGMMGEFIVLCLSLSRARVLHIVGRFLSPF